MPGYDNNYGGGRGGFGGRGHGFNRNDNRQQFDRAPPVKEGDELDVRIEAVGEKGDGVAKKDGFVLFIPNVNAGDEVHIKITKVLRKVGFAESTGPAEGPVDAPISAPRSRAPRQMSAAEKQAAELSQVARDAANMEDSEDFGEEDEAPAEDAAPSEPVEEASADESSPVEDVPQESEEPVSAPVEEEPVSQEEPAPAEPASDEEEPKQA